VVALARRHWGRPDRVALCKPAPPGTRGRPAAIMVRRRQEAARLEWEYSAG
jgi:hypothetical protein